MYWGLFPEYQSFHTRRQDYRITLCAGHQLLTAYLRKSKRTAPWEASNFSASREILPILPNPIVHNCIHKNLLVVPLLNQMNSVPTSSCYVFQYYRSIYCLGLQTSSFPQVFIRKFCTSFSPFHAWYMFRLLCSRFNRSNNTRREIVLWHFLLCNILYTFVT
jgi:hypothetical protein